MDLGWGCSLLPNSKVNCSDLDTDRCAAVCYVFLMPFLGWFDVSLSHKQFFWLLSASAVPAVLSSQVLLSHPVGAHVREPVLCYSRASAVIIIYLLHIAATCGQLSVTAASCWLLSTDLRSVVLATNGVAAQFTSQRLIAGV